MWEPTSETNYFFVEKNVTTQKLRVLLPIRFEKKYTSYITDPGWYRDQPNRPHLT